MRALMWFWNKLKFIFKDFNISDADYYGHTRMFNALTAAQEDIRKAIKQYPFTVIESKAGNFILQAVDVPEALTEGKTLKIAMKRAEEALSMGLDFYIEGDERLPMPSEPKEGEVLIPYKEV